MQNNDSLFAGVKLKHYRKYLSRLRRYAKSLRISVVANEESDEAAWVPKTRTIKLEHGESQSNMIATFLHELGHVLDDMTLLDEKYRNRVNEAYNYIYSKAYNKRHSQIVLLAEKRAWDIGRNLAAHLSIDLGAWYDKIAEECLDCYRRK